MAAVKSALVIGAGVAGPAMALALRKAGIEAAIYEGHRGRAEGIGGMLLIAPNGLAALRLIGVERAVEAEGQAIERMGFADLDGKAIGTFAGLPGLPPGRLIRRDTLHGLLQDHAEQAGIRINYGKWLTRVTPSVRGTIAQFADGTEAEADILIGADGIRSTVRSIIDPRAPGPVYAGLVGTGGFATGIKVDVAPRTIHFMPGKRGFMGYWPVDSVTTAWFVNLPHADAISFRDAQQIPREIWFDRAREIFAGDPLAREILWHSSAESLMPIVPIEAMPPVPLWHSGRMVLVGDSAHAPSPSSGQGASLVLESALELARCLRDLPDSQSAFAAYEAIRRPRVEKIAAAARKTNQRKAAGPIGKAVMRAIMPVLMKTVMTPERMFGGNHHYAVPWEDRVAA